MSEQGWNFDNATHFWIRRRSKGVIEIILTKRKASLRPADAQPIAELADKFRADVVQQIKDKPLEERITEPVHSKYHREIKKGVWVDVYEVLGAFTGHYSARVKPMVDHLLKKLLAGGERGHKDLRQDMVDVRDSAQRAIDTLDTWA